MSTQEETRISVEVSRCEQLLTEMVRIKSVVGEPTTGHHWVAARLRELGMTVEQYAVEGRQTPLVLGVLEGDGDGPGVLFDAHYDTVHAVPADWSHDPWGADVDDGVLYGRGAVDSKGTHVAMLAALEQVVASGRSRSGPIIFMSDSDGEDGFRGATLMADLDVTARVGTIFSAEATSNTGIEIAYPGISTWKVTAVGRTAHPTEPENGINAVTKMAKLVAAVDEGRLETPRGTSNWFEPRVTVQAIRTLPGGGWTIPGPLRRRDLRDDARGRRASTRCARRSRPSCGRSSRRTARSATSSRCCRWAPAACGCARARATRRPRASRRWSRPSPTCAASPARCASSTAAGSTRSS